MMFSNIQLWCPTRLVLIALIGSLSMSAIIGIIIILAGEFSGTDIRVQTTAGLRYGEALVIDMLSNFEERETVG